MSKETKALKVMNDLEEYVHDLQRESDRLACYRDPFAYAKREKLNNILDELTRILEGRYKEPLWEVKDENPM